MGKPAVALRDWDAYQCMLRTLKHNNLWREYLMFALAGYTAYRVGDWSQLSWYELMEKSNLEIKERKTRHLPGKKSREVYFGDGFKALIAECCKHMNPYGVDKYVFRSLRRGDPLKPIKAAGCNKVLKRMAAKFPECGIPPNISCHSLRKLFAWKAYESCDGDINFVAGLLGHRNAEVTRRYLGFDQEAYKKYYQSLTIEE